MSISILSNVIFSLMFLIVMFKHLAFGPLQTTKGFNKPVICIEKAMSKS